MPKKNPPTGTDADLNLATLSELFVDEDKARAFLESKRWPSGIPVCPHCGAEGYELTANPKSKRPGRKGLKKCKSCRKQFTVRVGTIFEESKIPISKWLMAIHLMTSSKKGVSSHQIARELGITQKSAWFVCHRIREAMRLEPMASLLQGEIEADESYVGGKPRPKNNTGGKRISKSRRGRGSDKAPVMVLVERNGRVRAKYVENVTGDTLKQTIRENVDPSSAIITDQWRGYCGLEKEFAGGHHVVNHAKKEYVRYDGGRCVTTNTAESWFALLKRAHYGIHHQFSKKHLHRYCDERTFVWDHRKVSDGQRMVSAIKGAEGKRLLYKQPIKKPA